LKLNQSGRAGHTAATFNFGSITTLQHNGNTIWHAGNDGAGTGLDADTVDGYQATNLGRLAVASTWTQTQTYAQGYGTYFATSGVTHGLFDYNNNTFIMAYNTANWDTSLRIGSNYIDQYASGVNLRYTGVDLSMGAVANPRFYMYNNAGTASTLIAGADSGAAWIGTFTNAPFRLYANSALRLSVPASGSLLRDNTYTMWDSGNDGAGSSLDADLLDGYQASEFGIRSAVNSWTAVNNFTSSNNLAMGAASGGELQGMVAYGNSTGAAVITFHRPGSFASYLGIDTDNVLKYGGWSVYPSVYKVWHEGSDGSGSGLDADLWDGNQFATYLNQAVLTSSSPTFVGWTITSDRNTKENIEDFSNVLPFIRKLQSKTYTSRISGQDHYGLIAQDVLEAGLSRAVHANNEGQLSLHMADLVALGLQGVKEVDERVTKLENIVKRQQRQISRLKRAA